jgi:hypothetical protein
MDWLGRRLAGRSGFSHQERNISPALDFLSKEDADELLDRRPMTETASTVSAPPDCDENK